VLVAAARRFVPGRDTVQLIRSIPAAAKRNQVCRTEIDRIEGRIAHLSAVGNVGPFRTLLGKLIFYDGNFQ
jgi:hypothetical protein